VSDRSTVSDTSSGTTIAHDRTQIQNVGGSASARTTMAALVKKRTNYLRHGVRVTAWARQIRMTSDEAIPKILEKLAAAPAGLLP